MKNDLVPVTSTWVKTQLEEYIAAHLAIIECKKIEWMEQVIPQLTRRRWFGLAKPIFEHEPSYEELVEYGTGDADNYRYWPYPENLLKRLKRHERVFLNMIEACAYGECIYLTPYTIEILKDREELLGHF